MFRAKLFIDSYYSVGVYIDKSSDKGRSAAYYDATDLAGLEVCFRGRLIDTETNSSLMHRVHPKIGFQLSEHIPVKSFLGKKEGDEVELTLSSDLKIIVTCSQKTSRYQHWGNLDDVLYNATASYGGVCDASYFDPPLSQSEQKRLISETHLAYAKSINKPAKDFTFNRQSSDQIN